MLIGSNGEKLGILSFDDAFKSAQEASLDLVQVSSADAKPVVCKLLDYGKYIFDKKKTSLFQRLKSKEILSKK